MWIAGWYFPFSRELLYGIGFLLFLSVFVVAIILIKRRKSKGTFSSSRVFKGKNLERAGKNKDLVYDDMPIVDLKWQKGKQNLSEIEEDDSDDEEEGVADDGYTVVEKVIQEKAQKLQTTPSKKTIKKEDNKKPIVKDATGDKMDFFTTGKSAL